MLPADTRYLTLISTDRISNKNSFGLKYERRTSVESVLHYFNIVFFYIIIIIYMRIVVRTAVACHGKQ